MKTQKIKKRVPMPKKDENENQDEDKITLLEYVEDIDDKLFKTYSHGEDFNIFTNKSDHATNKKDKEKIVKKLKEIDDIVYHYINMDENSEYTFKLIDIANAIDYLLYEYSKKWSILIGEKQSKIINIYIYIFFFVYVKLLTALCIQ